MAHDSFEEDMALASGKPRNEPNMAERTLIKVASERDRYKKALDEIIAYTEDGMSSYKWGMVYEIASKALEK